MQRLIDDGKDPRDLKRDALAVQAERQAAAAAEIEADKLAALTVGEIWSAYIAERRPHWGGLHYRDHIDKAKAGGLPSGRRGGGKQLTKPGPLAALMPLALRDLDQATIEAWAANEGKTRASSARLAWRLLTVFLTWCSEQPAYAGLLPAKNPAKTKKAREALGKAGTKSAVLQREQLPSWFEHVRKLRDPVISAYLQITLLTGRRREEIAEMKWEDVNFQWRGIDMKDKIEGRRDVPLTPYVNSLLQALPRRNEWVFSSPRSASGHLEEPNSAHKRVCAVAGLVSIDIQALRRSFGTLCEWLDIPGGISAQIQGHAPQGVREQNYIRRPLDLLRVHHEKIEAWILEQAGIVFDAKSVAGGLRVVTGVQ